MRIPKTLSSLLVAVQWALPLAASDASITQALNQKYADKVMTIRNFYSGDHLEYDRDGNLIKGGEPGPWTLDGGVEVARIKVGKKGLEIQGRRVWRFLDVNGKLAGSRGPYVRIDVETSPDAAPTLADLQRPFSRVFISAAEKLSSLVPDYWQPYVRSAFEGGEEPKGAPGGQQINKLTPHGAEEPTGESSGEPITKFAPHSDVTPPVAEFKPNPDYTKEARQARLQGTVIAWIVVGADGNVHQVRIVKPLGMGLDEQAVQMIGTWRFKPATRNGVPVPVRIMVETSFQLR